MHTETLQSISENTGIKLDPRTKLFLTIIINVTIYTSPQWYVTALLASIPISLLLFEKKIKVGLVCVCVYIASLAVNELLVGMTYGLINSLLLFMTGFTYRMLPVFLMGYYLVATTTVSEFIASMERIHLPKQIIIPLSVMFRFLPTIKEESTSISDAMRMRGIKFGSTKGGLVSMMEYRMVPLLMSCVKIGEELSAASLTRGLGGTIKRTNVCKIGFSAMDIIYAIVSLIGLVLFIIL